MIKDTLDELLAGVAVACAAAAKRDDARRTARDDRMRKAAGTWFRRATIASRVARNEQDLRWQSYFAMREADAHARWSAMGMLRYGRIYEARIFLSRAQNARRQWRVMADQLGVIPQAREW